MYHIIFNPVAGRKKAAKNLQVLLKELEKRGLEFSIHQSHEEHDATKIARELTEKGETELIVLGGDGTLHEVLNGIVDPTVCKLGLIPSGTGNDFAGRLGIPEDAEKAVKIILDGESKPTDYLEVDGVRCMNVAGLGMDVDVLERCKKGKFIKGKIKYLLSLLQSLFAFKGYKIVIKSEGREEAHSVLLAAACNGSQFGGGIIISPKSDVSDGKLNVIVVDCIGGKIKIIKAFLELMKGRILEYPLTTHYLCDEVSFLPEEPCSVQLDGEIYTDLKFNVVVKSGLQFYY